MKIELGKTYIDGNGDSVRILAEDVDNIYSVVGIVSYSKGGETIRAYQSNGKVSDKDSVFSLVRLATKFDSLQPGDIVAVRIAFAEENLFVFVRSEGDGCFVSREVRPHQRSEIRVTQASQIRLVIVAEELARVQTERKVDEDED